MPPVKLYQNPTRSVNAHALRSPEERKIPPDYIDGPSNEELAESWERQQYEEAQQEWRLFEMEGKVEDTELTEEESWEGQQLEEPEPEAAEGSTESAAPQAMIASELPDDLPELAREPD